MKLGVSAFAWTGEFTEIHLDLLPKLRDHGLEVFEFPMYEPANLPVVKIRRAVESAGLSATVCAILPQRMNLISPDADVRARSGKHLVRCVEAAAEMGAGLIAGPTYAPIGYLPGHRRDVEEWNWAVEALRSLTPTLDAHAIDLAIEPVNRSETFFLRNSSEAKAFCIAIDHARVGVTIDTFHANIEEKDIAGAVRFLGSHLKHLHASENDRGLLGSGHVDFAAIIQALQQIEYSGCLMIEGFGYSPQEQKSPGGLWAEMTVSPEDIAFAGSRYLRSLLLSGDGKESLCVHQGQ